MNVVFRRGVVEDVAVLKPKYRLQPVLDAREKVKEAAALLLTTRREQLAAAEEKLERARQEVVLCHERQAEAQAKLLEASKKTLEAKTLVTHRTHLADLRNLEKELVAKVEEQKVAVASAEAEVEKAIAALIEASKEVQVIEKHRENWNQRQRREEQLRDQKIGDEIGAVTYRRNQS